MTTTPKPLFNPSYAPTSDATVYTVPVATTTIIDKLTATNISGSSITLNINLIPSGGSAGSGNLIMSAVSIAAGATRDFTELQNQILAAGDSISIKASAGSAALCRGSGRETA